MTTSAWAETNPSPNPNSTVRRRALTLFDGRQAQGGFLFYFLGGLPKEQVRGDGRSQIPASVAQCASDHSTRGIRVAFNTAGQSGCARNAAAM
jgi:hypothetical protein